MYASEVIKIQIERPYAQVYDFLADPQNFPRWASDPDSSMEPLGDNLFRVHLSGRLRVIRLTPSNSFGVLDYQVYADDLQQPLGPVVPVRLYANDRGSELVLVWLQRPGVSEEQFRSDADWVRSDLQRLKSLLEVG